MSKVIARIQKRNKWPVKLGEDEIFIRAMQKREQREARTIDSPDASAKEEGEAPEEYARRVAIARVAKSDAMELRGYFVFGCIILEDDGSRSFTRTEGESPHDFAKRVDLAMEEVPEDWKAAILDELNRIQSSPGTLPKN